MTLRKQATLAGVAVFAACGDVALAYGMKSVGAVTLANWTHALRAVFTPWVGLGILLLMAFFAAYLAALSFADLTYVLPATSTGYVLIALMAKFLLHEQIPLTRWLGIALIAAGVGFVTQGPALTRRPRGGSSLPPAATVARSGSRAGVTHPDDPVAGDG